MPAGIPRLPNIDRRPVHQDWVPQVRPKHGRPTEKARRICNSKHQYRFLADAVLEAKKTLSDCYECVWCGTFHLSSRKGTGK